VTPLSTINLLRLLFLAAALSIGVMLGAARLGSPFVGGALGLVFALALVLADRLLKGFTLRAFSSATFGLLLGLVCATLLRASGVLDYQPAETRWLISLLLYATFAYLGMMLAMRSNRDDFSLVIPYVRFTSQPAQEVPLLLDTSVIIDGRLTEVCATGFLSNALVVPRFVLEELQHLADSADPLKRARGRRGFDHLEKLRRTPSLHVTIHDSAPEHELAADARLINLARLLGCRVVSNDLALGKIARLQGVSVLNLNDLAKALRPELATGDELDLALVKEGREAHQAVGYLSDGTMIVVNHARAALGKTVEIVIAGTLQTSAGRLLFAELKGAV